MHSSGAAKDGANSGVCAPPRAARPTRPARAGENYKKNRVCHFDDSACPHGHGAARSGAGGGAPPLSHPDRRRPDPPALRRLAPAHPADAAQRPDLRRPALGRRRQPPARAPAAVADPAGRPAPVADLGLRARRPRAPGAAAVALQLPARRRRLGQHPGAGRRAAHAAGHAAAAGAGLRPAGRGDHRLQRGVRRQPARLPGLRGARPAALQPLPARRPEPPTGAPSA